MKDMEDKDILLLVSGYAGEQVLKGLKKTKLSPFVAIPNSNLNSNRKEDLLSYSSHFHIEELSGSNFEDVKESLLSFKVILCIGWQKDFFHNYDIPSDLRVYHSHPSLLPKYRGYGAVSEQFLRGTVESGVSIYKENGIVDGGDIVYQKEIRIEEYYKPSDFLQKCAEYTVEFIKLLYADEKLNEKQQDKRLAFYLPKLRRNSRIIDFNSSAVFVYNFMRAYMNPYGGSIFYFGHEEYKVVDASLESWAGRDGKAGEVVRKTSDGITVSCGEGSVLIKEVEHNGKTIHASLLHIYEDDILLPS